MLITAFRQIFKEKLIMWMQNLKMFVKTLFSIKKTFLNQHFEMWPLSKVMAAERHTDSSGILSLGCCQFFLFVLTASEAQRQDSAAVGLPFGFRHIRQKDFHSVSTD